jgi:hypothetical protein
MMKNFRIFTISIFLITFLFSVNIYSQEKPTSEVKRAPEEKSAVKEKSTLKSIPSRSELQNAVMLNVGTEPLVVGVEYLRFLMLDNSIFPYLSMGAGAGTWLNGPSLWATGRFYYGDSNWAPFIGISITLWNGGVSKKDEEVETTLNALGLYIPLGIQYFGTNGLIFSFEVAVYTTVAASWGVKEVEKKPETHISGFEGEELKIKPWFGIKVGFGF